MDGICGVGRAISHPHKLLWSTIRSLRMRAEQQTSLAPGTGGKLGGRLGCAQPARLCALRALARLLMIG